MKRRLADRGISGIPNAEFLRNWRGVKPVEPDDTPDADERQRDGLLDARRRKLDGSDILCRGGVAWPVGRPITDATWDRINRQLHRIRASSKWDARVKAVTAQSSNAVEAGPKAVPGPLRGESDRESGTGVLATRQAAAVVSDAESRKIQDEMNRAFKKNVAAAKANRKARSVTGRAACTAGRGALIGKEARSGLNEPASRLH